MLSPPSVAGGNPSAGTVTLPSPAPAGGIAVALSSHDTRGATGPGSVTVPAGATSASFTINTSPNTTGEGQFAWITASAGGVERTQLLGISPSGSTAPGTWGR